MSAESIAPAFLGQLGHCVKPNGRFAIRLQSVKHMAANYERGEAAERRL